MDPRTDPRRQALLAAREEILAARSALGDETVRLESAARAAVDVKARLRRNPVKAASVVGGAAFVAVGGPRRVLRRAKRRIFGEPEPLPPSLLPDKVEKAVRALGDDGSKVRGALEREFAGYLESTEKARKADEKSRSLTRLALRVATPIAVRAARRAADQAFGPTVDAARGNRTKGSGG